MDKKTVALVTLVLLLTVLVPSPTRAWNHEDIYSFKRVYDHSNITEEDIKAGIGLEDIEVKDLHTEGGEAFLFSMNYTGKEEGLYRFRYWGGYYSEGEINTEVDYSTGSEDVLKSTDIKIDEIDIEFEGTLLMKKGSYGPNEAYGVVNQTLNTTGTVDIEQKVETSQTLEEGSFQGTKKIETYVDWNMSLEIDYTSPMNWLPTSEENVSHMPSYTSLTSTYSGALDGKVKKKFTGTGRYNGSKQTEENIEGQKISGKDDFITSLGSPEPFDYIKTCPVFGSPLVGYEAALTSVGEESSEDLIGGTLGDLEKATYNPDDDFLGEHAVGIYSLKFLSFLSIDIGEEKMGRTGAQEVDSFLDDKQGYLGSRVGEEEEVNRRWMYLVIILTIFISASTALYAVTRSRRKDEEGREKRKGAPVEDEDYETVSPRRKGKSNRDIKQGESGIKSGRDQG